MGSLCSGSNIGDGDSGDRPLGSAAALKGFAVHGVDGEIGSVDNMFIDDAQWAARVLVVATPSWLHGRLVQIPFRVVTGIDWRACIVALGAAREIVDSAPAWDPVAMVDEIAEERLRDHFGS